jgi:ATP-binding cassette subfamily B multidrug efflux pump
MEEEILNIPSEKINYSHSFKLFYKFVKRYLKDLIRIFFLFLISNIIRLISPVLIKTLIDKSIANRDMSYFLYIMFFYFFLNLSFFILSYYALVNLIKIGQRIIYELKNDLYLKVIKLPIDYFVKNNPGKISARIQSDTSSIYELFTEISITIVMDIFIFIGVFGVMMYNSLTLSLLLIPVVLFMFVIAYFYVTKTQKFFIDVRRKIADLTSFLSENIGFINLIKIFKIKDTLEEKHEFLNYRKFKSVFFVEMIASIFFISIMLLDPLSKTIIFGYGGIKVLNNELTIGVLVMFVLYIGQLFEPIFRFSEYLSVVQKSFASLNRINNLLNEKTEVYLGRTYVDEFKNSIVFDDVWMKYETSDWVLKGVSFELKKGKTISIVGRTGSGKSTIVNLLLRFYDYQKGRILIDGVDIKDISISSIRKLIGMVLQDVYLFPGTVMDNLKMMDDEIEDERVYNAIEILELSEFYKKIGMKKIIKEKGSNISSGEKQIISITRAMVLNQPIIILDEATSNIDPYTERILSSSIKRLMEHKTMIIIAHRLSTVENSDYIAFLNDGRIVEFGTHNELIEKKGYYYNFYKLQN